MRSHRDVGQEGRGIQVGEAGISVQMGFVSALKEAQEVVTRKRKRAFLVSLLKVWSMDKQQSQY